MHSYSKLHTLPLTGISLIFVGLSVLIKFAGTIWIHNEIAQLTREYSEYIDQWLRYLLTLRGIPFSSAYVGDDYPELWPIERKSVLMTFDNPKHFRLDTEDGAAEWSAIAPGNGVVYLGPRHQPYTVSMMHQLKCLDIIRQEMVRDNGLFDGRQLALARHCLNYVRQMVMCHGDIELESFQFASHKNPIDWHGVYECKDWEAVYSEVNKNQAEHVEWLENHTT